MKKNYLILLIAFMSPYLRSEIAFTQIKGLYSQLPDDKKHLSPVHGFNWWKIGIIENFWSFGNQNHSTIKLINDLFYLQPDGVTFDITTLNRKPAKYFTPAVIGKILAIIDHYHGPLSADDQDGLKAALFDSLKRMLNFDQLVAQAQQSIADAQAQVAALKTLGQERVKLQKTLISHDRLLKQLSQAALNQVGEKAVQTQERILSEKKQIEALNQEIENIKQRLGQRKQLEKSIHNNDLNEASLRDLVDYIVGSLQETLEKKYVPYTTHQVLLAFLWKKINEKAEFATYFAQVGIPLSAHDLEQSDYTQAEFKEFKRALASNPELVTSNYPLNSFVGFGNRVWGDNKLPLLVTSIGDVEFKPGHTFADCGETSLRNLFDIIIYNATAGSLDFVLLEQTATRNEFTLSQRLISYYKTYNDITKIQTKPYYDAWAQVVSQLPGVEYENEPGYEISAGFNNMMKVVNYLLFNNDEEFDAMLNDEKLDYLVEKLSRPGFSLTWKARKSTYEEEFGIDESGDNATPDDSSESSSTSSSSSDDDEEQVNINRKNTDIKIIFTINRKTRFTWEFGPNHFTITKPQKGAQALTQIALAAANLSAVSGEQRLNNANLMCWYVTPENIYDLNAEYLRLSIDQSYKIFIVMALNLRMNETILIAVEFLLNIFEFSESFTDEQLVQNLIRRLPTQDGYYADRLGQSIILSNAEFLYPMLNAMPIGGKTVEEIIRNKKVDFYPLVQRKLQEAYDTWDQMEDFYITEPYLALFRLEEFNELPNNQKFKELYRPLLDIYYATEYIQQNQPEQFPTAQSTLKHTLSQPLTPQINKQLKFLAETLAYQFNPCEESCTLIEEQYYPLLYQMLIDIINKTNDRETIQSVGVIALEDKLEPLYKPLHDRVVSTPDFHELILGIIKYRGEPMYDTVRGVVAKTDDVELLAKVQAAIMQKQIEELYPLANEIQERLASAGKERDESDGGAAATTTTTTSFMYNLMNSTIQFVQNLFDQVANTLALKS